MPAYAIKAQLSPQRLSYLLARLRRRGDDGLTDGERKAMAARWAMREAYPMTAQQYKLNPPRRSSIPGF